MTKIFTYILIAASLISCSVGNKSQKSEFTSSLPASLEIFRIDLDEVVDTKTLMQKNMLNTWIFVEGNLGSINWGAGDKIIGMNYWNDNVKQQESKIVIHKENPLNFSIEIGNKYNRGYRIQVRITENNVCVGDISYWGQHICTYKGRITYLQ